MARHENSKGIFSEDDIIFRYTSKEAEKDGILVDITKINHKWKDGIFNYVTANLLSRGYMDNEKINIPNLIDLLNQVKQIVKRGTDNFTKSDTFFSGEIELPSGNKQEVFIAQNETGKFTIMISEDY